MASAESTPLGRLVHDVREDRAAIEGLHRAAVAVDDRAESADLLPVELDGRRQHDPLDPLRARRRRQGALVAVRAWDDGSSASTSTMTCS